MAKGGAKFDPNGCAEWQGYEGLAYICSFSGVTNRQARCILLRIAYQFEIKGIAKEIGSSIASVMKMLEGAQARIRDAFPGDYREALREARQILKWIQNRSCRTGKSIEPLVDDWGNPVHLHSRIVIAEDLVGEDPSDLKWLRLPVEKYFQTL